MKYGILWRTKGLVKLLILKGEYVLSKSTHTRILLGAKTPTEEFFSRRIMNLIDQAIEHTNYMIRVLTNKTPVTDQWVTEHDLIDAQFTEDIGRLLFKLNEIKSKKEENEA